MRHDHTNWLIHFVRDRIPEQDFPRQNKTQIDYFAGGELDCDARAFDVLKTIIRLGGLLPGYSFRKGRTTIYGGKPAVCATEMPLYSFSQYVKSKKNTKNVSAYGLAFLKSDFHAAGGRPAIYGLSTDANTYKLNTEFVRIFDDVVLPVAEQYRYIAYNPQPSKWIDWSHEREWRWCVRDEENESVWCRDGSGNQGPKPGLALFGGKTNGCHFSKVYIIVWSQEEAKEIQEILTGFYLAHGNNYDTPFSPIVLEKSKIIVLERVLDAVERNGSLQHQTIEGIEQACLVEPIVLHNAHDKEIELRLKRAIAKAEKTAEKAAINFQTVNDTGKGLYGFAYASTYDVTSPTVQLMLQLGLARGPYDGRVLVSLKGSWSNSQLLDLKEVVYEAVSVVLKEELKIEFAMYSRCD